MKCWLLFVSVLALTASAAEKPNLLFLFADDLTWKAVGALSDEDIDTPHLDRLAARGTAFTRAYNSGAWHGAVCVASRTMLNTGRQLWRARAAESRLDRDYVDRGRLWPRRLAAAGYRTCFSGKWHIRADHAKAFEETGHYRPGGMPGIFPRNAPHAYERPVKGEPDPWDPADPAEGGFWEGGRHWSAVVADDFEAFAGETEDDPRPWFAYLAFNAPHDPRQAPREYLDRYPLDRVGVPENFQPVYPHRKPMGAPQSLRDERLAPSPRTRFAVKTHRREYYAIISHLDAQIGRVLDHLEGRSDAEDTYIIFTADHGLACGEHGLMGKQNLYEHSVRVPLIVAGPDVPAGREIDAPVYLQDVMPTTLALAGAEIPDEVDFRSLAPLWRGGGEGRQRIYGAYRNHQRMILKDGRKLILYPKAGVHRVFDLRTDPHEMRDLAGTPRGETLAAELFPELLELQDEMDDPLDLEAAFPDL